MKRAALVFSLTLLATPALAQKVTRDSLPPASTAERLAVRTLLGTVGGVGAGYVLGNLGMQADLAHDGTQGDDPGLGGALLGAGLGWAIGSAIGAAIPEMGMGCSFGKRLGRSFAGSFGTVAVSALAAAATGGGGIVVILAAPVNAAAAHGRC